MVYYFTSNVVSPAAFLYVGRDKVESQNRDLCRRDAANGRTDEELIKYGLEDDVWCVVIQYVKPRVFIPNPRFQGAFQTPHTA